MCSRRSSPSRDSSLFGLCKDKDVVVVSTNGEALLESVTIEELTKRLRGKVSRFWLVDLIASLLMYVSAVRWLTAWNVASDGISIKLTALPLDGSLVLFPPKGE